MTITKEHWITASEQVKEEDRKRLGPPEQITNEMLVAYCAGELSEVEMERVCEFVCAYDELRAVVEAITTAEESRGSAATWNSALEAWIEDERQRLGGPPSREEIAAYLRGELSPPDMARVRALLVYYPDLTELLPYGGVARVPIWRRVAVPAAALVIALAVLAVAVVTLRRAVAPPLSRPLTALEAQFIEPDGNRCATTYVQLEANDGAYLLVLGMLREHRERPFSDYLLTFNRLKGGAADGQKRREVVWSGSGLRHNFDGAFTVVMPEAFLPAGRYEIDLYGTMRLGSPPELLATYYVAVQGDAESIEAPSRAPCG